MPKKVHDRAEHIMKKNPKMPESEAWAIAQNQVGKGKKKASKSPKKGNKK